MPGSMRLQFAVTLVGLLALGCGTTGYTKVDGAWAYVTWDEGNGRKVHDLAADNDSFVVIDQKYYAKDKQRVFYEGQVIAGADPASFQVINRDHFAKDKQHVYLMKHRIAGADPASFQVIRGPYSRDASRVYCGTVPMETASVEAFELLQCDGMWMTCFDKGSFLFDYGESFSKLEISSQQPVVVGSGWGRDGKYYYHGPGRVEGADYATFKIIDSFEAADKDRKFMNVFPEDELPARRERFLGGQRGADKGDGSKS